MARRLVGATLIALLAAFMAASPAASPREQWYPGDGYDWWTDCSDVPDPLEFLPVYLGSETPGFVDLRRTITRSEVRWRVMQYTRDKDFGTTRISANRWYGGMGADEWPAGSPDAARFLDRFRVTAFEIDGNRHAVDPSCVVVLPGDDHTISFYNAWVRFGEPGLHTLKVIGRQIGEFFFTHDSGLSDPFGLEGRRVFLAGELAGDAIDDEFVHTYELNVGKY
ncbi:MAG TPA: hypothetical protein VN700_09705 [Vicinamibacterales bacterium]|nr:hypothetical protein [Vicinamibacterales bacterium]